MIGIMAKAKTPSAIVTSMRLKPCGNRAKLREALLPDWAEIFMSSVLDWKCEEIPKSMFFKGDSPTYTKNLPIGIRKKFFIPNRKVSSLKNA